MTLEKQLQDWKDIKFMLRKISILDGLARKSDNSKWDLIREYERKRKTYEIIYKTKFSYNNSP